MENDLFSRCQFPFDIYFKELTDNIILFFDGEFNFVQSNQGFREILDIKANDLKDKKINEFFDPEITGLEKLSTENSYQKINLRVEDSFIKKNNNKQNSYFLCYIFSVKDFYCLIGEKSDLKNEEIIKQISRLNNKLANKSRELTKKNKKLEQANKRIEKLNRIDFLTGLANRRHFMEYLKKMFAQASRYSSPLSFVMIDLDNFKKINDTYGHSAGDDVLAAVGDLLNEETRQEDLAARLGGEEFGVLLVQTDLNSAEKYAERIRKKILSLEFDTVQTQISASLGVCEKNKKKDDDPEDILKRADNALYQAKNSGRNRVCSCQGKEVKR
ncbi:MAG: diguanylate cyclase [Bacillota bacterium]